MNNKGAISILTTTLASAIFISSTVFLLSAKNRALQSGIENEEKATAEIAAAELLEVFASLTSNEMLLFMSKNPLGVTAGFSPYPLCAHINLLDRTLGKVMNADPQAEMPQTTLLSANRYYQIQVLNIDTMQVNYRRCMDTAEDIRNDPSKALKPNERLLVTVGVKWEQKFGNGQRNALLTTILARQ